MKAIDEESLLAKVDETEYMEFFPDRYRIGRTKYIFITGGVMSGIGKGVFTASFAHLLKHYGLSVSAIKIDGYLNVDAGTLNPYRHGETFVLADGTECDMDLGTYERFIDQNLNAGNYLTSGKLYQIVIKKERHGEYLGRDVLVIPHVTGEIKHFLRTKAHEKPYDILLVEIGGTVGDIENVHFIEAARQMIHDEGKENVLFVQVTVLPYSESSGDQKTKPTQHSVKKLLELGIQPDVIVCRTRGPLQNRSREKISLYCNVPEEYVVSSPEVENIYTLPNILDEQNLAQIASRKFEMSLPYHSGGSVPLLRYVRFVEEEHPTIKVAIAGKYSPNRDSYVSVVNALRHCEPEVGVNIEIKFIDTKLFDSAEDKLEKEVQGLNGIIIPGGYGRRGVEGMIRFIQYCRESGTPFLGLCFGFQLASVEFARNVGRLKEASSTEFEPDTRHPVICLLQEQKGKEEVGATQRLGNQVVKIVEGTLAHKLLGVTETIERFRHRWEFNPEYRALFEEHGILFSAFSEDWEIAQAFEYPSHRFYLASQFHPEFTSRPLKPHPFFVGFVKSALAHSCGEAHARSGARN